MAITKKKKEKVQKESRKDFRGEFITFPNYLRGWPYKQIMQTLKVFKIQNVK